MSFLRRFLASSILTRLCSPVIGLVVRNSSKHQSHVHQASEAPPCLDGQTIVFVGPSTSKADYLALTYFVEYGKWPDQEQVMYGPPGHAINQGPNPLNFASLEYEKIV